MYAMLYVLSRDLKGFKWTRRRRASRKSCRSLQRPPIGPILRHFQQTIQSQQVRVIIEETRLICFGMFRCTGPEIREPWQSLEASPGSSFGCLLDYFISFFVFHILSQEIYHENFSGRVPVAASSNSFQQRRHGLVEPLFVLVVGAEHRKRDHIRASSSTTRELSRPSTGPQLPPVSRMAKSQVLPEKHGSIHAC